MEIKDFNLVEYKELKIKIGKQLYEITNIPATIELDLLKNQVDNLNKLSTFSFNDKDQIKWKSLIKRLLKNNCEDVNDSDIDTLGPLELSGFMNLIYLQLSEKSKLITKLYDLEEEVPKKK